MPVWQAFWNALYETFGGRVNWALTVIPALIVGFTLHEYAHAWMAVRLGDPTPRWQGRLTLNPLRHLDPIGTLLVFVAFVGWAKPVVWNPGNLRVSRRLGTILVAAAGPVSNLFLAVLGAILLRAVAPYIPLGGTGVLPGPGTILVTFVVFNVLLFVFNLIPLPPLDGFAILSNLAPPGWYALVETLRQYGTLILIVLLFLPGSPLYTLIQGLVWGISTALLR